MTKAELVKALEAFPDDMPVIVKSSRLNTGYDACSRAYPVPVRGSSSLDGHPSWYTLAGKPEEAGEAVEAILLG